MSEAHDELVKLLGDADADRLYAAVSQETFDHLRLHADAVAKDDAASPEAVKRAQDIIALTDVIAAKDAADPWWLEMVKG